MLYKTSGMGHFGRVHQNTRGPWYQLRRIEDDGLEWYYAYAEDGDLKLLLSNNMSVEDRESFARLWHAHNRASGLAMFAGAFLGLEAVTRIPYFRRMAIGWRVTSFFGLAYAAKCAFNYQNANSYGPTMGAYLRKYEGQVSNDAWNITDRKREYFEIDTSQYMAYTADEIETGHNNVGPQPVSYNFY